MPVGAFYTNIPTFTNLVDEGVVDSDCVQYAKFIGRHKNNEYHKKVAVLMTELPKKGNFLDFIRTHYKQFTSMHWKVFFFQLLSTLAVIHSKYPSFRHNNLKINEVFVDKVISDKNVSKYSIRKVNFKVPKIGYSLIISNFDFSNIPGILENEIVGEKWTRDIGIFPEQNQYYDMHYFFSTLTNKYFFADFLTNEYVPLDAKEFVSRMVPQKYRTGESSISSKGRLLTTDEYTTPFDVLLYDEYFKEFMCEDNVINHVRTKINGWTIDKPIKEINSDELCPISFEKINNTYSKCGNCNNIFSFEPLLEWLSRNKTCPMCRNKWTKEIVYLLENK